MRVPLSWLREFVPVAEDASAEDLMATLVKVGLEEEDVHRPPTRCRPDCGGPGSLYGAGDPLQR